MLKKLSVFLAGGLLLTACGEEDVDPPEPDADPDPDDEEVVAPVDEANAGEMQETEDLSLLGEYMAERSFVSDFGVEALENYVAIDDELTYMELDEFGEATGEGGSSMAEVIDLVDSVIEDAVYDTFEDEAEAITTITFHYFDPENVPSGDEDEEVMNYGDMSFVFEDDQLYLSNVAPGWFEVSMDAMLDAEEYADVTAVEDLKDVNPELQLLTIGKMNINGQPFIQAMFPSNVIAEDGDDMPISHYLYFVDNELVFGNYISFFETSQNFPLYSIQAMNGYFHEMREQNGV